MTIKAKPLKYVVICRDDTLEDGSPGPYALATRTVFREREDAVTYSQSINYAREPIVVVGPFDELRFEDHERIRTLCRKKS